MRLIVVVQLHRSPKAKQQSLKTRVRVAHLNRRRVVQGANYQNRQTKTMEKCLTHKAPLSTLSFLMRGKSCYPYQNRQTTRKAGEIISLKKRLHLVVLVNNRRNFWRICMRLIKSVQRMACLWFVQRSEWYQMMAQPSPCSYRSTCERIKRTNNLLKRIARLKVA